MSYWSMEIYWTYANEKKINLYVKLQDQYVQPDQSGFIDQARDRHHAFTFFPFFFMLILISVMVWSVCEGVVGSPGVAQSLLDVRPHQLREVCLHWQPADSPGQAQESLNTIYFLCGIISSICNRASLSDSLPFKSCETVSELIFGRNWAL